LEINNGNISYENEKDTKEKLAKFAEKLGILNNTLKRTLVQKFQEKYILMHLALPILLYGNEIWTLRKSDKNE
jgi:lambda repressor-like predicted transcriptional regulator